jgi:hypothetical protein
MMSYQGPPELIQKLLEVQTSLLQAIALFFLISALLVLVVVLLSIAWPCHSERRQLKHSKDRLQRQEPNDWLPFLALGRLTRRLPKFLRWFGHRSTHPQLACQGARLRAERASRLDQL